MTKLIIGLTGGIGCGKTKVADYFHELGVEVIDADLIAREVVATDMPALLSIVKKFGADMLDQAGSLNREALRRHVFEHPEDRAWLEKLLHPLIRAKMLESAKLSKSSYCIMVIPLLVENLPHPVVNHILVVDSPENEQIKRIIERDNVSKAHAVKIIDSQATHQERLKHADDIIENDSNLTTLKSSVKALHKIYLKLSKAQF